MDTFVNVLIEGTLTSATFALVALGFSLIFGVGGTINLAHGSFFMVAAYVGVFVIGRGAPVILAVLAGVATGAALGVFLDRVIIAPIRHQEVSILISTLSIALIAQGVVIFWQGAGNKNLPPLRGGASEFLGVKVLTSRVVAAVVAALVVALVLYMLNRTRYGRTVQAVAEDDEAARLMGISTERVNLAVMALGGGLAGLAGVLVAPYQVVFPTMWLAPLTLAFAVVILGGLGSISGTVIAAVVLGFLDRFVAFVFPNGEANAPLVTFVVILGTLILRPQGLRGKVLA